MLWGEGDAIVVADNLKVEEMNTPSNEWKVSGKVRNELQLKIKAFQK
jgi:hypothetical protein